MIKITQNEVTKNFTVSVALETSRETYKITSQVARILAKSGVVSVSTKSGEFVIDFASYNDEITNDDVLWILIDKFNVGFGFWDYLGIFIESFNGSVATNKDGSCVKIMHKNAHKLREDKEFPFVFAGGLQYFEVFKDTIRLDFHTSHEVALQIYNDLIELLDSLD